MSFQRVFGISCSWVDKTHGILYTGDAGDDTRSAWFLLPSGLVPGNATRHRGQAMTDKTFSLRVVTAALSQDFPCKLSFKQTYDRRGASCLVPVLLLELGEADYQALQDVAGVTT